MAFENGVEEIACPACGARHRVDWYRLPVREKSNAKCGACREPLLPGSRTRAYENIALIR
jgi:predicted Zn finger-like uncharacterized protein